MIIFITRPDVQGKGNLLKEAALMGALFGQGLQILHLRKPDAHLQMLTLMLDRLSAEHRSRIAVHPPAVLFNRSITDGLEELNVFMQQNGLRRLHISSWLRQRLNGEHYGLLQSMAQNGALFSTGIHQLDELIDIGPCRGALMDYRYLFVSPLLDSISKDGYKGNPALWHLKPETHSDFKGKLIGLGGIRPKYLGALKMAGFDGAALMGAVWPQGAIEDPEPAIEKLVYHYKTCVNIWNGSGKDLMK
jgi:thiamine-phosphate pyrophosphorylase